VSGRTDVILLRHAWRAARDPAAFVQTVAANLISAAVRLIPLGQTAGLRVLVALINLAGVADLRHRFPALDLILIESGGDNLAATFSPELADLTIYVIDVSAGDNPPGRVAQGSPAAIFSSSTRSTSPPMLAPTWTSWTGTPGRCAASARSCSSTSARVPASRSSLDLSKDKAA